jgi:hypothetical protein
MSQFSNGFRHKSVADVMEALDIREGDVLIASSWYGLPEQLVTACKQPVEDPENRGLLRVVKRKLDDGVVTWGVAPAVLVRSNVSAMARRDLLPDAISGFPTHSPPHD